MKNNISKKLSDVGNDVINFLRLFVVRFHQIIRLAVLRVDHRFDDLRPMMMISGLKSRIGHDIRGNGGGGEIPTTTDGSDRSDGDGRTLSLVPVMKRL